MMGGTTMPRERITARDADVQVGWSAEANDVQIGVTPDRDFDAGRWTSLTREQCNQVIRALRKARDRAYGPDA